MKDYILKLNEFISHNYKYSARIKVTVDNEDIYLIHIFGYNEEHCISVKLSKFPFDTISFYGYNIEESLDLNTENFEIIKDYILKAINNGIRLTPKCGHNDTYEFLFDKMLTASSIKELYADLLNKEGKAYNPCKVICSNFSGTQILEADC